MAIYFRTPNNTVKKASDIHMGINGIGTKRITSIYYGVNGTIGKKIYPSEKIAILLGYKNIPWVNINYKSTIPSNANYNIAFSNSKYPIWCTKNATNDAINTNGVYTEADTLFLLVNRQVNGFFYRSNSYAYNNLLDFNKIRLINYSAPTTEYVQFQSLFYNFTTISGNITKTFENYKNSYIRPISCLSYLGSEISNVWGNLNFKLNLSVYMTYFLFNANLPNVNVNLYIINHSYGNYFNFAYSNFNSLEIHYFPNFYRLNYNYQLNFVGTTCNYMYLNIGGDYIGIHNLNRIWNLRIYSIPDYKGENRFQGRYTFNLRSGNYYEVFNRGGLCSSADLECYIYTPSKQVNFTNFIKITNNFNLSTRPEFVSSPKRAFHVENQEICNLLLNNIGYNENNNFIKLNFIAFPSVLSLNSSPFFDRRSYSGNGEHNGVYINMATNIQIYYD